MWYICLHWLQLQIPISQREKNIQKVVLLRAKFTLITTWCPNCLTGLPSLKFQNVVRTHLTPDSTCTMIELGSKLIQPLQRDPDQSQIHKGCILMYWVRGLQGSHGSSILTVGVPSRCAQPPLTPLISRAKTNQLTMKMLSRMLARLQRSLSTNRTPHQVWLP